MRIERIIPPARPGKPWLLGLTGGKVLRVTQGEMADFALYSGMELEEETLAKLERKASQAVLRDKAVDMLTANPMSSGELIQRLAVKGASQEAAEQIAAWAAEIGLLNDESYAATVVCHYGAEGYGIFKIKSELSRRRIPREYWDEALAQVGDPGEAIDGYLAAHLKSSDRKAVKKASDALSRRGFSWQDIAAGLERFRAGERD